MKNEHKRCIFHIPNKLDDAGMSGSQVRPRKMLSAFQNIGYDVDVIMGDGKERKYAIKKIEQNIRKGIKYDFLYSENSTMPTLLTEENHFPKYPFLDFNFFNFCKKNGIKIGLFYRDIYWRFPIYRENVSGIKFYIAQLAYRYDLFQYIRNIDVFFVPNKMVAPYLRRPQLSRIMKELPPGSEYNEMRYQKKISFFEDRKNHFDNKLNLFYVGGIGNQYNFDELLKGIQKIENIYLTICCREKEWNNNRERIKKYLTDRIEIVHESGEELEKYYAKADICLAYFKPDIYIEMAIPIKLFEYISHLVPILASNNTATGKFVSENKVGWSIDYSFVEVNKLLKRLSDDYAEIYELHRNCRSVLLKNRWEDRAEQVVNQLYGDN